MPVFAAIGGALIPAIAGSAFASAAVGIIATAAVGAAIGGLTAAVTGGDIGKGMLFGAVGTVATAGILSGVGAATGAFSGGTFGIGGATQGIAGAGMSYTPGGIATPTGMTATTGTQVAGQTGGSSLFGGLFGGSAETIGGKLITEGALAAGQGIATYLTAEEPYYQSEEYFQDLWAREDEASLSASGGGYSGAGHAWNVGEEGTKWQYNKRYEEEMAQRQLMEQSAMARLDKEYLLRGQEAEDIYERETAKFGESAALAGAQKFEGADEATKQAIVAKQEAEKPTFSLLGAQPEQEVA